VKAIVFDEYGPPEVLHLAEVEKPVPDEQDVLIKVSAASVTRYDTWERSQTAPPGFNLLLRLTSGRVPQHPILGTELAGVVERVGEEVTRFAKGDPVMAYSGLKMGASAEYVCYPEDSVALMPPKLSHVEAAGVLQSALTALYFLRKTRIEPGAKVLIVGASGGVGSFAVQLAKHHFGAEVTGVCRGAKMEFVRSLGADHVIDYSTQEFTRSGQVYDVIFDTYGKSSILRSLPSLAKGGAYLFATFGLAKLPLLLWYDKLGNRRMVYGLLHEKVEDLELIGQLLQDGVIKPVVDRTFPWDQAAEAHRYVESGQKRGSVILTLP
jgi:NADPH:quinone reductase-like Zn-dependent oxidoreductase